MKKLLCLFLTLALVLASAAAFADALPEGSLFKPGTYSGEAQGIFVPVKVMVQVSETEIETVLIDATGETPELGGIAAEKMAMSIMKAQTPNVDTVSGATVTSNAIIAAATQALEKAGADIAVLDANRKDTGSTGPKAEKTIDTEIVIIGAGGAGMTAAIMLQQAGKDFVILEKMPYVGGNTTKATGGMNASETHYQKE